MQFADDNGSIMGFIHNEIQLLKAAELAFTMALLDSEGNYIFLSSNDFHCRRDDGGYAYNSCSRFPDISVKMNVRELEGVYFFRPEVHGIPISHILDWFDGPQVVVPSNGNLFYPFGEGLIIDQPEIREEGEYGKYHPLGFPVRGRSVGGFFPGICQMQFMAFYTENGGIYFGAHDPECTTKAVEYAFDGVGGTRLSLQTFCGGCRDYISPFEYVLASFDGDWMDACEIYRDWLKPEPVKSPVDWLDDSPVVVIYPVRGDGDDCGKLEANEYFPYINALPYVDKYAEAFNCRIMVLLMHWEGTAPWAPPYVWPPFGGEEALAEYRDALHVRGHLLGLYGSGSAWTQKSSITDYSCEEKFEKENLARYMMRGPKGEMDAVVCNGENSQRLGYDMCLTEEWSRRTVKDEIMKLANFGVDYAQYFDQNLGGAHLFCYSSEHHHPPAPGLWQVKAMRSLLTEANSEIVASGSKMLLGCEAAAADPYLRQLPFNDARPVFGWDRGISVPAYAFVHHEEINNFMGNQCGLNFQLEMLDAPENLLYRTAYSFNAGDMLSVVLKNNGLIHWNWVLKWDYPEPDQENIITLIRNLNQFRKQYPEFLRFGRMLKPLKPVTGGKYEIPMKRRTVMVDSFLHSSWRESNGGQAQIITNFLPWKQTVDYDGRALELEPLNAVIFHL